AKHPEFSLPRLQKGPSKPRGGIILVPLPIAFQNVSVTTYPGGRVGAILFDVEEKGFSLDRFLCVIYDTVIHEVALIRQSSHGSYKLDTFRRRNGQGFQLGRRAMLLDDCGTLLLSLCSAIFNSMIGKSNNSTLILFRPIVHQIRSKEPNIQ